jgi:hypothetical protein
MGLDCLKSRGFTLTIKKAALGFLKSKVPRPNKFLRREKP